MEIQNAIKAIEKYIKNPKIGLPEELFLFISRLTPMVNVDLLIKDEKNRTLLAWRDDKHFKAGWHVPGGIIRYKEKFEDRIKKVAELEIGTNMNFDSNPIAVNEIILKQKDRAHFISFLYKCYVPSSFIPENKGIKERDRGFLKWHEKCPDDLIKVHEIYRRYI